MKGYVAFCMFKQGDLPAVIPTGVAQPKSAEARRSLWLISVLHLASFPMGVGVATTRVDLSSICGPRMGID